MAQVLPGPNVVNLSMMIGDRLLLSDSGAAAFWAAWVVLSLVVALLLAALVVGAADSSAAQGAPCAAWGAVAAG